MPPSKSKKKPGRKPPETVKGDLIRLRITKSLLDIAAMAAARDGRDISMWLRWLIVQRAKELGIDVPDIPANAP
jgi:hypothetical protein